MSYNPQIKDGYIYLNGRENLDGSRRFAIDTDTGYAEIQKRIDGIWQPASFEVGNNSLWVGLNVGLAGVGHHLVTENVDGHLHFHAHSEFDGNESIADVKISNVTNYVERQEYQPDESGNFTGTVYEFLAPGLANILVKRGYLKTHTTPATAPVRIQTWLGTDDTGLLINDQTYPASNFPANSETTVYYNGYLEFELGNNYFTRYSSAEPFSLKTNATVTFPWIAIDTADVAEESLLQTRQYIDGDTYTNGEYLISNRKIYECNVTGVQTGTFASNSDKWDVLSHVGNDYWDRTDTTLQNKSGVDEFIFNDGTRDRIEADSTSTRLTSPNGTKVLEITNSGGSIAGNVSIGQDLTIGNDIRFTGSLYFHDTNRDRMGIWSSATYLKSPNGLMWAEVYNDSIKLGFQTSSLKQIELDATNTYLRSPDETKIVDVSDSGIVITGTLDAGNLRIDGSELKRVSGSMQVFTEDGTLYLEAYGSHNIILDAYDGEIALTSDTRLASDKDLIIRGSSSDVQGILFQNNAQTLNGYINYTNDGDNDGHIDIHAEGALTISSNTGIEIAGDLTVDNNIIFSEVYGLIKAFDEKGYFAFNANGGMYWQDVNNSTPRLSINATASFLIAPNALKYISIDNSSIGLVNDAVTQVEATDSNTYLRSPDGTKIIDVDDTDISITGNLGVSGWIDADGYIVSRNKLQCTGTGDGTTLLQFETDRRWVFQQEGSGSGTALRLRNLNGINKHFNIDTDGYTNFRPVDGLSNTVTINHATGALWATTVNGLTMASTGITYPTSFAVNDGTKDRVKINSVGTYLYDEPTTGGGVLTLDSKNLFFNDGTRNRIFADDTDTSLFSPSGDLHVEVTDTDVLIKDSARTRIAVVDSGNVGLYSPNGETVLTVSDNNVYITSTIAGFIVPNMTTTHRDALTPSNGTIIYNISTNAFNFYENGAWVTK